MAHHIDGIEYAGTGLRARCGLELLDEWTDSAGQVAKNAVFDALFAMLDRTVFAEYVVVEDPQLPRDLVVLVTDDVAVRVRLADVDTFDLLYIGDPRDAVAAG